MPLWIQMLIVCAILSERLKAPVYKALYCWTEDCVYQVSDSFGSDNLWSCMEEKRDTVRVSSPFSAMPANECLMVCWIWTRHYNSWGMMCTAGRARSRAGSLTDFCGGYCDVVPHIRLSVQRLGQRDLPVVHVDVELPLQVCVPINEVPAKSPGVSERTQNLAGAYFPGLVVV